MNRYFDVINKKAEGIVCSFKLRTKLYAKKELPAYDFNLLQEKWPYVDAMCVRNDFTNSEARSVDLSICIPMYNLENYILRLLEQIDRQETHFLYEVLLVDDGSTDNTASIVSKFIKGKENYHLIRQRNVGISAARNAAINIAEGRYLAFVDGDDEICDGFIEKLMSVAVSQNADIVKGRYCLKRGEILRTKGIASGYIWGGIPSYAI